MMKKIFICLAAVAMLAALSACGKEPAEAAKRAGAVSLDESEYSEYYSQLAYEVRASEDVISEQMYYLYEHEGDKQAVGKKNIYYDTETGEMERYTVSLGKDYLEKVIDYRRGYTTTIYSEMFYDADGNLIRAIWENTAKGDDGAFYRDSGEQTYYEGSSDVKTVRQDRYKDDVIYESLTQEYDKEGNIISETKE